MISMEKAMKKLTKTKKIIFAAVAAVLCFAAVLSIILVSISRDALARIAAQIARKQNFQMDVILSGIPLFGSVAFTYEVDGNIQHIPDGSLVAESYTETVGDKQYQYTKDENGKWVKSESASDILSGIQNNERFKQLVNFENYESVEGKRNVYRQKADVVFEDCKDVTITVEKDTCTIEMILYTGGMALDTVIVISNIGKIDLTLPVVG